MKASAKIMVVDDEARICQNVKKILSSGGYDVVEALNARDALEKMSREPFSLLISDIVMPETNGLTLLKQVKNRWPQTRALMMTAYASTDTAAKAIRLGALDYILKPFTPAELRFTVERALAGDFVEVQSSPGERELIDVTPKGPSAKRAIIDVDAPFDREDVAKYTGEEYAASLGSSDMPVTEVIAPESRSNYCPVGKMACDMFEKIGGTCKVAVKSGECPRRKAEMKKAAARPAAFDGKKLIGVDLPFIYDEVVSVTGPQYLAHLDREGMAFVPYEALKERFERQMSGVVVLESRRPRQEAVGTKRMLIVDDEVAVNNNLRKIFGKKGYDVAQAVSKEAALEKIENGPYDIVLLDLRLPGVKGLELLHAIREKQPHAKVIVITGYASIETAVETARIGAVDYLAKPFTPDEIRSAADRALKLAA